MWHTLYLCDGVAVQQEVSKVLAELMWAVGGNQEEDEYAGRFYLEMEEGEGSGSGSGSGELCDEVEDCGHDHGEDEEGDDDEMQIIEMQESSDEEEMDDEDSNQIKNPADDEDVKHCRGAHLSALYVRTFFRTLTREWSNMDKYRIDKFYTLSRLILREIYRYMASRHWNLGIIRLFNDAIFEEVLRANKYGNGVRYHLLDICLEELARVNGEEGTGLPLTEATFLDALEPYFALAQRVEDKMVQQRVMDKIVLRFLEEFSVASDNYALPEDGEDLDQEAQKRKDLVMDQVHVGTVGQFIFELASDTETSDRYRTGLYDMHKTFMKRLKAVGRDVAMSEEGQEEEGDEDVPVEQEEEEEAVVEDEPEPEQKKSKKKKKKAKTIVEATNVEVEEAEQEVSAPPKKDKASKKKKKKTKEAVTVAEPVVEATEEEDVVTPTKKKRKSKKAQQEPEIKLSKEEEEIITISMQDQKAAAKAVTKAAKAAKVKSAKKAESASSSKRVKFGKMNQSKSYKASMKDLKKVDPKAILVKTPEKSILLKKKNSEEKKRRKKSR